MRLPFPLAQDTLRSPADTVAESSEVVLDTAAADSASGSPLADAASRLLQRNPIFRAAPDTAAPDPAAVAGPAEAAGKLKDALGPDALWEGAPGRVVEWLHGVTGLSRLVVADLLLTLALVVVLWGARALVLAVVNRRSADARTRYQWRKTSSYVAVAVGVLVGFRIWIGTLGSLATFLGLLSAGLAIALRDPLVNLAGWLFIVWKKPFVPGDRISIRLHTGDVIDQRVFQFTLLEVSAGEGGGGQSTGRIIHVPNGWVFADSVINFTRGFQYIWNELSVVVPFESNWRAAKELLLAIAHDHADHLSEDAERRLRRAAQEYMIFYSKLTPTVYTSVRPHGVQLTLRYLVEPRRRRGSEQTIWEAVLDGFAARDDVDFGYPTSRVFRLNEEGKEPLRRADQRPADDGEIPDPTAR